MMKMMFVLADDGDDVCLFWQMIEMMSVCFGR
jgi:hypothetical protein